MTHSSPLIARLCLFGTPVQLEVRVGVMKWVFFVCLFLSWSSLRGLVRALACLLAPGARSSKEKPGAPFGTHLEQGGQQKGQKHSCFFSTGEMLPRPPSGSRPQPQHLRGPWPPCALRGDRVAEGLSSTLGAAGWDGVPETAPFSHRSMPNASTGAATVKVCLTPHPPM